MGLVERWEQALKLKFPERDNFACVLDINAQRVLVPRFLRAIKPPEEVFKVGEDSTARAVRECPPLTLTPTTLARHN